MSAAFWSKVDQSSECWMWLGSMHAATGYGRYSDRYAHRVAYELTKGPIGYGLVVDHTCHNRGCVNPDHLRAVTIKQNVENRSDRGRPRGVSFEKSSGRWMARVKHNRRMYNLGRYATEAEAAEVARKKRVELFTHNDLDRL